jgi:CRISPR-associated protein Csm3
MERMDLDTPYGEVKWEVAIDRITSAANPRQLERVPAGAVFSPAELIYGFYNPPRADIERFRQLIEAMQLLENDYLGGHGSRGSGKIAFRGIRLTLRTTKDYERELTFSAEGWDDLPGFVSQIDELLEWLRQQMPE